MTAAALSLGVATVALAMAADADMDITVNGQAVIAVVQGDMLEFGWNFSDNVDLDTVSISTSSLLSNPEMLAFPTSQSGSMMVDAWASAHMQAQVWAYDADGLELDHERVSVLSAPRAYAVSNACETVTFTSDSSSFSDLTSALTYTDASGNSHQLDLPAGTTQAPQDPTDARTVTVEAGSVNWEAVTSFVEFDVAATQNGTVQVEACGGDEDVEVPTVAPAAGR